jgi:hypothetical protein
LTLDDSIEKDREAIQENIKKKIAANGWKLTNNAPISVSLKIKKEEEDTVEYSVGRARPVPMPPRLVPSPFHSEGMPIEFQAERFTLSITQGDTTIWSKTHQTSPPSRLPVNVVQDASLQEVVDRAMEEQSYTKWLDSVTIPQHISRQGEKGMSRVTENGIENVRSR